MTRNRRIVAIACLAVVVACGLALAAGEKPKAPAAPPQMTPEMKAMMEAGTPNEHHKHMAIGVGTWKAKTSMWMQPGAPPMTSEGTMKVYPVLGGRFFASEFKGEFMGQPFEGRGLDGYDNVTHKHVSTWADTLSTMILTFTGTCSDGGKKLEQRSDFIDPATRKPSWMRNVTTVKDNDHMTFETYGPDPAGKEVKMMQIDYTRMAGQ